MTTTLGKWSKTGVPHRGWSCVGIDDLEEPSQYCEMCESVEIRYVHHMEHPDYHTNLGVGCICAEHMEEDYVNPRLREKKLRSKAYRRKTWPKRKWSAPVKGYSYLNTEGFKLVVFPTHDRIGQYWTLRVTNRSNNESQHGLRRYLTEDAAKTAALDALLWAKDNL